MNTTRSTRVRPKQAALAAELAGHDWYALLRDSNAWTSDDQIADLADPLADLLREVGGQHQ